MCNVGGYINRISSDFVYFRVGGGDSARNLLLGRDWQSLTYAKSHNRIVDDLGSAGHPSNADVLHWIHSKCDPSICVKSSSE